MTESQSKTECDRCGTCCTKGGPSLHYDDKWLLQNRCLKREHLVTIRKGEPVLSLFADNPASAQSEIIKIKGKGIEWSCLFFDEIEAKCTIYGQRPIECSLLKCWDTAEIEETAGKNLLSRYDIIASHEPILPFIKKHDEKCSLDNLALLISAANRTSSQQKAINELNELVNTDLAIRSQACEKLNVSLDFELLFFGRPLFTILTQFGIEMHEKNGVCCLSVASCPSSAALVKP